METDDLTSYVKQNVPEIVSKDRYIRIQIKSET